ncbi:MAG: DedA family protein [Epsilonproteobacteria bacterium]|nr:DedA family protein [Campylobacterota bacterium]
MLDTLTTYGYIILAFYSFGGGMAALIGAAILSSMGKMDINLSILIASISNFIGDNFLFLLTKYNRKEIGKYLKKHRRKIAYSTILMRKYGWATIFIKKYIYGVKTLIPIVMALSRYDFKKFVILNFFASILWGVVVGYLSYFFADIAKKFIS